MFDLIIIKPFCREKSKTERLSNILDRSIADYHYDVITTKEEFEHADLTGKKLIFAVSLGESGINLEYYGILKRIRLDQRCLQGCVAGIIIDGNSELYTKSVARDLTFSANLAGCTFVGKPLVEGTRTLKNYDVIAKNICADQLEAYAVSAELLVKSVVQFEMPKKESPNILMLHSSNEKKSNTMTLWEMVKKHLEGCTIEEISLQNGEIYDCIGCPYTTCFHFGERNACFYGGLITEKVYPAVRACDALVMVCPNYNDAVGANIAAFINRLTSIFRTNKFSEKQLFALIVSGYSGGDIVAQQLISSLCMNKTLILPPRFALIETANNPGDILGIDGIEEEAREYAQNMLKQIKK